ncbi:endolytic transglycosylase MltG [Jiella sonneratiae]|uniref:Endolytic murein transglycosylase n=1 Tax=Jiella sonneratiae TaxID=2816856 RepID=A0ABS3J6C3_9HYPH|nr:endolytic transglycosylase MltG [Jiella sonneratiae]MBO0905225.1 endolytic transglycosylase MltG [Jiella sonneratiae]
MATIGHRSAGIRIMSGRFALFAALSAVPLLLVFASVDGASARSQSFGPFRVDDARPDIVRLEGIIDNRAGLAYDSVRWSFPHARTLELASPGGNLIIALQIAQAVYRDGLATRIPAGDQCLSACAFIFLAGHEREASGKLGVHRVASAAGDVIAAQLILGDIAEFLDRIQASPQILRILLSTPFESMHVFDADEIVSLGINRSATTGSPAIGEKTVKTESVAALVRRCDELVASDLDDRRPDGIAGVPLESIEAAKAVAACEVAVKAQPGEVRLGFELARSLQADGSREEETLVQYREAAELGYPAAQTALGLLYATGRGVARDTAAAETWFNKAAEQGSAEARQVLHDLTEPTKTKEVEGRVLLGTLGGRTVQEVYDLVGANGDLSGPLPELVPEGTLQAANNQYAKGATRSDVIQSMRRAQDELVARIWRTRDPDLPVTSVNEFMTLASMIERETAVPSERPRVAAVFMNRLRKGMRLQSDPTVLYGIRGGKGASEDRPMTVSDLASYSPYNTYIIKGLPPGPIANPSGGSLEAAAHPARTDDLYFVSDGKGGHAFASNLSDHAQNVRLFRQSTANSSQ